MSDVAVPRVLHYAAGMGSAGFLGYRAVQCFFGCGLVHLVRPPTWPALFASGPPGKVLHVSQVFLLQSFLGWDVDYVYLGGSPRLGVHLRTRALEGRSQNEWTLQLQLWRLPVDRWLCDHDHLCLNCYSLLNFRPLGGITQYPSSHVPTHCSMWCCARWHWC